MSRTNRTWHKGPPPHIGWWNASQNRSEIVWRWWNGVEWSWGASCNVSAKTAASWAGLGTSADYGVEWSDYYPEGARVPRVNPSHSTGGLKS